MEAGFYKFFGSHIAKTLIKGDPYTAQNIDILIKSNYFLTKSIKNFKEIVKNKWEKSKQFQLYKQGKCDKIEYQKTSQVINKKFK